MELRKHTRHTIVSVNKLAYVAHHNHAYILSTNRERRGEKGGEDSCGTKECTIINIYIDIYSKIPTTSGQKRDRLQTRKKHLLNTYRTERDRCKESETSDGYIQVTSKEYFFKSRSHY